MGWAETLVLQALVDDWRSGDVTLGQFELMAAAIVSRMMATRGG